MRNFAPKRAPLPFIFMILKATEKRRERERERQREREKERKREGEREDKKSLSLSFVLERELTMRMINDSTQGSFALLFSSPHCQNCEVALTVCAPSPSQHLLLSPASHSLEKMIKRWACYEGLCKAKCISSYFPLE